MRRTRRGNQQRNMNQSVYGDAIGTVRRHSGLAAKRRRMEAKLRLVCRVVECQPPGGSTILGRPCQLTLQYETLLILYRPVDLSFRVTRLISVAKIEVCLNISILHTCMIFMDILFLQKVLNISSQCSVL